MSANLYVHVYTATPPPAINTHMDSLCYDHDKYLNEGSCLVIIGLVTSLGFHDDSFLRDTPILCDLYVSHRILVDSWCPICERSSYPRCGHWPKLVSLRYLHKALACEYLSGHRFISTTNSRLNWPISQNNNTQSDQIIFICNFIHHYLHMYRVIWIGFWIINLLSIYFI